MRLVSSPAGDVTIPGTRNYSPLLHTELLAAAAMRTCIKPFFSITAKHMRPCRGGFSKEPANVILRTHAKVESLSLFVIRQSTEVLIR